MTNRPSLPPILERRADRIAVLAEKGNQIAALDREHPGYGSWIEDKASLTEWLIQVENIVETTFGENSPHVIRLRERLKNGVSDAGDVHRIRGLLLGGLEDLRGGFLARQEFLIAGEVLDSVLEQAAHLLARGYKDAGAVLGRVIVENALKRLCRREGLVVSARASRLNDELRQAGIYGQPRWRQIQSWLDIGNAAAHGDFDEYDAPSVKMMLDGVASFLANELGTA